MRQQGGFFYWVKIIIILAIVGAGFFYGEKVWASQSIIISEVQVGGATATDEFIELYNNTDQPINLLHYRLSKKTASASSTPTNLLTSFADFNLPGHSYYLITHPAGYDGETVADAVYSTSQSIADNNTIILYSDAGKNVVDKVGYGTASDFETQVVVVPDNKLGNNKSIIRKIINGIMQDTDNNAEDFEITSCPSPKAQSAVCQTADDSQPSNENHTATSTPEQTADETASSTGATVNLSNPAAPAGQKINFGDVLINELVSDPADNEVEWIELYNRLNKEIDLTGWRLEDGSKAKTNLSGSLARYKVIEKPNGNLNNDGDLIVLYDATGKIIDQVTYGNWNDGDATDNAPVARDPDSLARKFDGYNTYDNLNDFAVTLKPTKGAANIIEAEDEISAEAKAKFDFTSDIFISEIMPNPASDDTKLEYIEIYNAGRREVNLTGWSLSNEDNKKINLEKIATSTIIKAGEYLALYRPKTKIVLHNDRGQVKLFEPLADKPFINLDYKNVKEGWSYNLENPPSPLYQGGSWIWSETITPGAMNVFKITNHPPEVEFSFKSPALINVPVIFDSSDTVDAEDDILKFTWDFGDGFKNNLANPEHVYFKTGIYKVKLAVSDGLATSTKEKSVKVVNSLEANLNAETPLTPLLKGGEDGIIINEILPNPAGADTGQEWLEIKNQSETEINLLNWRVENSNGKYKFTGAQLLAAGAFYVLDNALSQLAFKNTADVISLYNDLDELADTVEYANATQGESYARGANGSWFWTTRATPGQGNVISIAGSALVKAAVGKSANGSIKEYVEIDLEKIRELELGSLVKVKGTVAVEPGILGVQIFYIVGSPGIQIYNYKKDFPTLHIGDYIEVTGELAQTQGEFRIKTKDKSGINLLERKNPPVALAVKNDEVSEENIGQLITITGEITDKKSTSLYLDDGNDEIFIYIKQNTGIDTKSLTTGQKVSLTGILSKTQTGLRLLPRYQTDIMMVETVGELAPQVLGEVAAADEWDLAQRDKKLELFKYLLIIAGGVIMLLVVLFVKIMRKSKKI